MLDTFLNMTWRNPIFMAVAIGTIWFLPGIVVRRIAEKKYMDAKAKKQSKAIEKLYPKKTED